MLLLSLLLFNIILLLLFNSLLGIKCFQNYLVDHYCPFLPRLDDSKERKKKKKKKKKNRRL